MIGKKDLDDKMGTQSVSKHNKVLYMIKGQVSPEWLGMV